MDVYYHKYTKYKDRYNRLKKILSSLNNQKGGGKPTLGVIKNINLFETFSDMDCYLNPIHGIYYAECNVIDNMFKFYHEKYNNNGVYKLLTYSHD